MLAPHSGQRGGQRGGQGRGRRGQRTALGRAAPGRRAVTAAAAGPSLWPAKRGLQPAPFNWSAGPGRGSLPLPSTLLLSGCQLGRGRWGSPPMTEDRGVLTWYLGLLGPRWRPATLGRTAGCETTVPQACTSSPSCMRATGSARRPGPASSSESRSGDCLPWARAGRGHGRVVALG